DRVAVVLDQGCVVTQSDVQTLAPWIELNPPRAMTDGHARDGRAYAQVDDADVDGALVGDEQVRSAPELDVSRDRQGRVPSQGLRREAEQLERAGIQRKERLEELEGARLESQRLTLVAVETGVGRTEEGDQRAGVGLDPLG